MITMDLKGITWVGHVYQKFETMCLEVEEIMYQDTVKYVENQVQTVGASVKKFYSDVMQDIIPLSSVDQVKETPTSDSVAGQHQEIGFHKKPIVGLKVANKPLTENSIVTVDIDETASQDASFHGFLIEDTSFQSSSENHAESSADGDIESDKPSFEGISICHSGQSEMDGVQCSYAFEPIGNLEVEDSCVLVNGDGLNFFHHKDSKYKPYKKKIQDAISARMRSTRKQEYKQLAVRYGEDLKSIEELAESLMPLKRKQSTNRAPSPDTICESDWELL